MEIEIKEKEYCKLSVNYTASSEEISEKRKEVLAAFKKAPVPGFRKGKATTDAIKIYYRSQIDQSLKRALEEESFHNTIFEKKLRPYGSPKFNSSFLQTDKFTSQFELMVKPNFELSEYKDFTLPKPHEVLSASDLTEKMLQELRIKHGTAVPYTEDDFVQKGDNIIINYEGSVDGVKLDNLSAEAEMITVGNSQLVAFDDALLGMSLGETREFNLVVPGEGLPSLAGKSVHFKVTLNMGAKNEPCPLNDELAVKLGKSSFQELRDVVAQTAMVRTSQAMRTQINSAINNVLLENMKFEVPNWLTLSEAKYLANHAKLNWDNIADVDKERFLEIAEKNVRLSLILDKIRENEPEAQIADQEVFDIIKQNIEQSKAESKSDKSLDDILSDMNRTGYLQILFSRIKDENTIDFIAKTVKFVE